MNTDASVEALKGPGRPVVPEGDRAMILAALESVDAVTLFDEATPQLLIGALLPDVLVKGGDYSPDQIVGREEVQAAGGEVKDLTLHSGTFDDGADSIHQGNHDMIRGDGRKPGDLRPTVIDMDSVPYAEGSCLIATGNTRVLCAASVQDEVPDWRASSGKGWVTGEYGMLPRATHTRGSRERQGPKGRTQEIQRLIGRSLRSVCDMGASGAQDHHPGLRRDPSRWRDPDRLHYRGGRGTEPGLPDDWSRRGSIPRNPMRELVAAVSVGLFDETALLDLDYSEDSRAQVDMNLVATESGKLVEVQGTAEGDPFSREAFTELLDLGMEGIRSLILSQKSALGM